MNKKDRERKKAKARARAAAAAPEVSLQDAAREAMESALENGAKVPNIDAPKPKKAKRKSSLPAMPRTKSNGVRKPKPTVECACGCKTPTKSTWAPGHDARAHGWALRVHRKLLKMSDVPVEEQPGCKFMIKRLIEKGVPAGEVAPKPKPVAKVKAEPKTKTKQVKVDKGKTATRRIKLVKATEPAEPAVVTTEELQQAGEPVQEQEQEHPAQVASGE